MRSKKNNLTVNMRERFYQKMHKLLTQNNQEKKKQLKILLENKERHEKIYQIKLYSELAKEELNK